MDDLLADFVAETREMLEAIEGELVAWETDPSNSDRLDSIFRFLHTVKGNCGFFDFPELETLSHAAESVLAEIRSGHRRADTSLVSAILAIIDRITFLTNAIDAGDKLSGAGHDALIAALGEDERVEQSATPHAIADAKAEANKPSGHTATPSRSIRLPVDLLDRVMSGVSDMVLARNELSRRLRDAGNEPALNGPFERLSGILTDVREAATRMRMQRIEHLYNALPRLVRDLSSELGKQVLLDFEGGDVELDREMIEMIRDPITHLIRNAIDHGFETPSKRFALGKREIGLLSIASSQSGNKITIVITDDGGGLDEQKIGQKAVSAGLVSAGELKSMTLDQIAQLIFEPGLSTADEVSAVSGRGVGMDVVRSNLEKIGGSIAVVSKQGEGTKFFLELPLTLSIISALTVSIDGQYFAIPHSYVEEIAHGKSASVEFSSVGDTDLVSFRGERIPCLTLNSILNVKPRRAGSDQRLVLLRPGGGQIFAIAVDQIHDQEDLVIKPLSPAIMACHIYAGTTLLDDGRPVLLLDIPAIAAQHKLLVEVGTRAQRVELALEKVEAVETRTLMTFVDLDGRRRALDMQLILRIDEVSSGAFNIEGERGHVVIDGKILDLAGKFDGEIPDGDVRVLRLSDSNHELAYPVAALGESIEFLEELAPVDEDETIEGLALIEGQSVPVLDGFHLFARNQREPAPEFQSICALPEGNVWAQRMLRPLLVSAGYRLATNADETFDVTIKIAGGPDAEVEVADGEVITLYSDKAEARGTTTEVYRYDKAAIVQALLSARQRKTS